MREHRRQYNGKAFFIIFIELEFFDNKKNFENELSYF